MRRQPGTRQATTETELVRDVAIRHHHAAAGEFERRYQQMERDRYSSAFTYGRHQIDEMLLAELRRLPAGSRVLDVGCGTGAYFPLIRELGLQGSGVEPADAMRAVARRDHPEVDVQTGVATSLPAADSSFDLVMAIEVYRYLDAADIAASYREARRVLRPGGRFFFTMVNRYALDGFWLLQRGRERLLRGRINDAHPHCEFVTPRQVAVDLAQAGFADVRCEGRLFAPLRLAYKVSTPAGRWLARRSERVDGRPGTPRMAAFAGHLVCVASVPAGTEDRR